MISLRQVILFIYSALLLVGGIMGFIKANSWPSLLLASFSAVSLVVLGWFLERKGKTCLYLAVLLLFLLDLFFSYRFLQTFKFFPSGLLSIINFIIIFTILAIKKNK